MDFLAFSVFTNCGKCGGGYSRAQRDEGYFMKFCRMKAN